MCNVDTSVKYIVFFYDGVDCSLKTYENLVHFLIKVTFQNVETSPGMAGVGFVWRSRYQGGVDT